MGRTSFALKSLTTGENYDICGALVVPAFLDDERTLPHAVDTSRLKHFEGVEIPLIPECKSVDILIGQLDKALLTVLKEQEGTCSEEPNLIFTRLGPIASAGRVQGSSDSVCAVRLQTISDNSVCSACDKLQQELVTIKDALREFYCLTKKFNRQNEMN